MLYVVCEWSLGLGLRLMLISFFLTNLQNQVLCVLHPFLNSNRIMATLQSLISIKMRLISLGKKNKRKLPIEELTTTEDKYLGNLIMVRDVFRERLSLMSVADKGLIFYLLDDLILLHSDLLEGLTTTKYKDIGKTTFSCLKFNFSPQDKSMLAYSIMKLSPCSTSLKSSYSCISEKWTLIKVLW